MILYDPLDMCIFVLQGIRSEYFSDDGGNGYGNSGCEDSGDNVVDYEIITGNGLGNGYEFRWSTNLLGCGNLGKRNGDGGQYAAVHWAI